MKAKLRVAVVAPSMGILGGQAVQAQRLLTAWQADPAVEARLVPINPMPPRGLRWAVRVKYARTLVTQLAYWPMLFREIRRADVVHVFSASYFSFLLAPLPAILVAKLFARPVLVNYRSGEAPDHLRRSRVARWALARVRNVVPSTFLRGVFSSFGLAADVIPNIVDPQRFRFRQRDRVRPALVSTRNFESLYNVECALRAFRLVQDERPDASLTLVGSGSLERTLRDLAAELRLRNVSFVGQVPPGDIWRYYGDADIYVQTPDIDNMPSSVLEAWASGLPVVSTNAGGVPAIVTDGVDGLLAPVGSHEAIASQVLRLLREPELAARIATTGRRRCTDYTWAAVRDRWLDLYRELAAARSSEARDGVEGVMSVVARVRAMDRQERGFRARTLLQRASRRLLAAVRAPRWRRSELAGRLVPSTESLRDAVSALENGEWLSAHDSLTRHFRERPARFVVDVRRREALCRVVKARFPRAEDDARERADRILAGQYDLLGYKGLRFVSSSTSNETDAIADWKLDPVSGRRAVDDWWSSIDFLDPRNGDHKVIWELNRHQHWMTLGRAFWLSGRREYRDRFVSELEGWLRENQPLSGINWASMLELSLRCLSWLWAMHFFLDDAPVPQDAEEKTPWLVDLLLALDRQMRHVEENLSRYFSPNTHLTGEALGLYVAGRVLPELRDAGRWETAGRETLIQEAERQVLADGGHAERSPHYHRYTLDFYLLALAVARVTGDDVAERAFAPVVERLASFASAIADTTGRLPRIGDDDAGTLMPLGSAEPDAVGPSLAMAASLLPGRVHTEETTEDALWLTGTPAHSSGPPIQVRHAGAADASLTLEDSGYCVSRTRCGDHLVFDTGRHGYLNGGHAHADALSLTLTLRWHQFLIDCGTGTYTIDQRVRDRFRSTALHNTLVLDGRSQSVPAGPFHWHSVADAVLRYWALNPRFDFFEGSHDGYAPLLHRRAVYAGDAELWLVADHVLGPVGANAERQEHEASVGWHLEPAWQTHFADSTIHALHPAGLAVAMATDAPGVEVFKGDTASGLGWCSPAYGRIVPCSALRFTRSGVVPISIVTAIVPTHGPRDLAVERLPLESSIQGDHAAAVRVTQPDRLDIALFAAPSDPDSGDAADGARVLRRFAGFETDARFAHVRLTPDGAVVSIALVEASYIRRTGKQPFAARLPNRADNIYMTLEPDGCLEIFAAESVRGLRFECDSPRVDCVRVNDVPVLFAPSGATLTVGTGEPRTAAGHQR